MNKRILPLALLGLSLVGCSGSGIKDNDSSYLSSKPMSLSQQLCQKQKSEKESVVGVWVIVGEEQSGIKNGQKPYRLFFDINQSKATVSSFTSSATYSKGLRITEGQDGTTVYNNLVDSLESSKSLEISVEDSFEGLINITYSVDLIDGNSAPDSVYIPYKLVYSKISGHDEEFIIDLARYSDRLGSKTALIPDHKFVVKTCAIYADEKTKFEIN